MFRKVIITVGIAAVWSPALFGDFSYHEKSTITGGAMAGMMKVAGVFSKAAREPMESTIAIKGDRMAHRSATHASIIDLNAQTITTIDMQKKQYYVMTFEQMKQMMDDAMQKMQQQKEKNPNVDVNWKVSANSTGNAKTINGFDAKEFVIRMEMEGADKEKGQKGSMIVTTHTWIAPGVPGYAEVREFHKKMAEKLAWTPGNNMFMSRPDMAKGMTEAFKEMSKLDGTPVLSMVNMGGEGSGPADGSSGAAAQPAPQQQQEKPSLGGALGGALGGKFGLGRKKSPPADSQQPSSSSSSGQATASANLIEMTTEYSNFSTGPVDESLFSVPAGFKKVEPDMHRAQ